MNKWDIVDMLRRLRDKTGLPCNAHTFRRSFASILAKRGVDSLHIMRLGRWECLAMVDRYTKSVKFEDSLKLHKPIMEWRHSIKWQLWRGRRVVVRSLRRRFTSLACVMSATG